MTQLPFPSGLSQEERQNLDSVRYKPLINLIRFDWDYLTQDKLITVVPSGGLVRLPPQIAQEEVFNQGSSQLNFGTSISPFSIGIVVFSTGIIDPVWQVQDVGEDLMKPFTSPTSIYVTCFRNPATLGGVLATQGSGWGLFEWINLNNVKRV